MGAAGRLGGRGWRGAPSHALHSTHAGGRPCAPAAGLCSRQEPAQPSLWLPPGHRHRRPGWHHPVLWLPLRRAVPLPDAVPAELSAGLLERVEPGQELHHPRERWVRRGTGGSPLPRQAAQPWWHGHTHPARPSPVAAPTGKLDAWWSARPAGAGGWLEVQLRWKVSTGGRWGRGGCRGSALGTEHPRTPCLRPGPTAAGGERASAGVPGHPEPQEEGQGHPHRLQHHPHPVQLLRTGGDQEGLSVSLQRRWRVGSDRGHPPGEER